MAKKKNKLVSIYKPESTSRGRPGQYASGNKAGSGYTAPSPFKPSEKDDIYGQISKYSQGAQQDAARRAGINANASSTKEGQKILDQLRQPTFKRSSPSPAPAKAPAPSAAAPSTPSTPYSSQINTLASDMMSQQQQFDQRYGQQQSDFQNMMIQFRDQANERALAAEKMFQDLMISQQQAEARAAAEREAAQRRAEITQRTSMANQMRAASASPQLKLGSSESDRNMYGTTRFKRRSDIVSSVAKGIQNRLGNTLGGINV